MATYLLTWNSEPENWNNLDEDIYRFENEGIFTGRWSSGNTKKIVVGDRVFLIKLGKEPKGIMASGWAISDSYSEPHWNPELELKGKTANYVEVNFDNILRPEKCLPRNTLEMTVSADMNWSPFGSGISINDEVAEKLEIVWAEFIGRPRINRADVFPDEAETEQTFNEGSIKTVTVNYYERDRQGRDVCINHFGLNCVVCGFNFEERYGEVGKGFIHVHHLRPLSELGGEYQLSPIKDLRPVCPNCHAMLHKRKPAYSIEELIERLGKLPH